MAEGDDSIPCELVEIIGRTDKPVVVNIDAGSLYDPLAEMLSGCGVPVFRRSDEALLFLGKYVQAGLRAGRQGPSRWEIKSRR